MGGCEREMRRVEGDGGQGWGLVEQTTQFDSDSVRSTQHSACACGKTRQYNTTLLYTEQESS